MPHRLLDVPELSWQVSRIAPAATTAVDGVAQLLLLLPDLIPNSSSTTTPSTTQGDPPATAAAGALDTFASGELLLASAGSAEVQQAVLASLELLQRLLGSGLAEQAQERAMQMLQQQQRQLGLAVAVQAGGATGFGSGGIPVGDGGGAGSCSRLCLMGLMAPEKLGFPAAGGELCYFCMLFLFELSSWPRCFFACNAVLLVSS